MDIIPRAEWGAVKEAARPKMKLPAREVWLHHTVTGVTTDPFRDMRQVQLVGIQRFGYISYSYCVHPSGDVLEGQGLRVGAHTKNRNSTSFGISLIGNYNDRPMLDVQVEAVRQLIDWLSDAGHLRRGVYPTGGHRDLMDTACPGNHAYARMGELRLPWEPKEPLPEGVVVANAPFACILAHPPSGGYLEIGEDGGVFTFGGAPFHGSLGGLTLNQPIVDAAWTSDYGGYYLLGRDGGIFAFGNARHQGNALWSG